VSFGSSNGAKPGRPAACTSRSPSCLPHRRRLSARVPVPWRAPQRHRAPGLRRHNRQPHLRPRRSRAPGHACPQQPPPPRRSPQRLPRRRQLRSQPQRQRPSGPTDNRCPSSPSASRRHRAPRGPRSKAPSRRGPTSRSCRTGSNASAKPSLSQVPRRHRVIRSRRPRLREACCCCSSPHTSAPGQATRTRSGQAGRGHPRVKTSCRARDGGHQSLDVSLLSTTDGEGTNPP
jgi:hypothetical protein